jgi:hypothetical protein
MSDSIRGRCFCGAVTFAFDGKPNWTLHCHCESCRRATSSPITTWLSVQRAAFWVTSGEMKYHASSPGVKRGFCGKCGSQLSYEADHIGDEIHLYAASLEDPGVVRPERHVFASEQLPWFETADDLPRYASTSRGNAAPIRFGPAPQR